MCGICGVVQLGGPLREVVPEPVLANMAEAIRHRRPADVGLVPEAGIVLAARRLSVIAAQVGRFAERSAATDREQLLLDGRLPCLQLAPGPRDRWLSDTVRRSLRTRNRVAA